jgi:hypothetical protein
MRQLAVFVKLALQGTLVLFAVGSMAGALRFE